MMSGSVRHTLEQMCGVWHDHIEVFDLAGRPLAEDARAGTPGPAPWDNLVYVELVGDIYRQTNVTFAGRPLHVRTFTGVIEDEVLRFDRLGPDDPEHIGVSCGPGVLFFAARKLTPAWGRYLEPDCIRLTGPQTRTRTTLLYRDGVAVRSLTANGYKVQPLAGRRVPWDPRGTDGPVHAPRGETQVFQGGVT
jgi:hypothetical protein